MSPKGKKKSGNYETQAESYQHKVAESPMRPEVGTQPRFRKKKPPATYRYDSSLSPALDWDGQNGAREQGEALIREIAEAKDLKQAQAAAEKLKALSKPFLNWAGKAERLSFEVPTLPLFVHERLSTKAIIETLKSHKKEKTEQLSFASLFGDPQHSVADQVLRAYEHKDPWVNRMILGDSQVVMNSLLHYEGLGGQVQMIYIDPPYGVKFGSNFQPFVRKRDVSHNDDNDFTREPEMVQAYRDTWELGPHSYLTYLRDRLLLSRELLAPSGSVFVQISDENLHHVRELMDEVFGADNFISQIAFVKTTSSTSKTLSSVYDCILWYSKERKRMKYQPIFSTKIRGQQGATGYTRIQLKDGTINPASDFENDEGELMLPAGASLIALDNVTSQNPGSRYDVPFAGRVFRPEPGYWKTDEKGMKALLAQGRIANTENKLAFIRRITDFPAYPFANVWTDTLGQNQFGGKKLYSVQTALTVIRRCLLMTTDPGDLIIDPTCGSGTTAYVAEQWGRRWITMDTSRVPLALARQRLLTATFEWYELKDESRGPASGFVYKRKQNSKGEEIGGIVPHITLKSIANNDPPGEEVMMDRPEKLSDLIRVSGPFAVEATIPTPVDWEGDGIEDSGSASADYGPYIDRMIEVLRKSPILRLPGNKTVQFKNIRPPAKTLTLAAEGLVINGHEKPVAFVFGPENGAVSEALVVEAAKEAYQKSYSHLYVIGFAIQPNARKTIEEAEAALGLSATYVQATPDLMMGDLLKHQRASQIFSVCGQPEAAIKKIKGKDGEMQYQVTLLGFDIFDPIKMETDHVDGDKVPAWLLDSDYNGLCFKASQVFFPRTGAWDNLKKALKATHDEAVWDHLAGTTSAPFDAGEQGQIAVKVIDDRGNELIVVKKLSEAK